MHSGAASCGRAASRDARQRSVIAVQSPPVRVGNRSCTRARRGDAAVRCDVSLVCDVVGGGRRGTDDERIDDAERSDANRDVFDRDAFDRDAFDRSSRAHATARVSDARAAEQRALPRSRCARSDGGGWFSASLSRRHGARAARSRDDRRAGALAAGSARAEDRTVGSARVLSLAGVRARRDLRSIVVSAATHRSRSCDRIVPTRRPLGARRRDRRTSVAVCGRRVRGRHRTRARSESRGRRGRQQSVVPARASRWWIVPARGVAAMGDLGELSCAVGVRRARG